MQKGRPLFLERERIMKKKEEVASGVVEVTDNSDQIRSVFDVNQRFLTIQALGTFIQHATMSLDTYKKQNKTQELKHEIELIESSIALMMKTLLQFFVTFGEEDKAIIQEKVLASFGIVLTRDWEVAQSAAKAVMQQGMEIH